MASSQVNREAASGQNGEVLVKTFQTLLAQREKIDRLILKTQGRLFKSLVNRKKTTNQGRKTYVDRVPNKLILVDAIRQSMVPGQEMTMQEVISSLEKTGTYHTNSEYFYTMVNNKLNRDRKIKKVGRGVFLLKSRPKKTVAKKRGRPPIKIAS